PPTSTLSPYTTLFRSQFAGLRAASDRGDFIIEFSPNVPGLLHLAGIESPGLTAAPAIAADVPKMLEEKGFKLTPKENFQPRRERSEEHTSELQSRENL